MKPVQYFTDEYIENCAKFSTDEVLGYLEDFREMQGAAKPSKSRLVSIRIEDRLLELFKMKAKKEGSKYQTKLKELMWEYVK